MGPSPFTLAPGRVNAAGLVFFALAAVPAAFTDSSVPLVFAVAGVLLLIFSVGYVAMARRAPHAGALYSIIARGLGRPLGVAAGLLAPAAYLALQLSVYGLIGRAAAPLLSQWYRLSAPWWTVAAVAWLLVTLAGLLRVEVAAGLLGVLVLAELAVLGGLIAANLTAGHLDARALDPRPIDRSAFGLLLVPAVLAFTGFETLAAYGEESRGPRRSLPRATYLTVAVIALLATAGAWSTGGDASFPLWAVSAGRVVLLTGLLAALISLQHTTARYLFALGREHVLPSWLGRTAPRTSAPRSASLMVSVLAGLAIGACAGWRFDPQPWLAARLAVGAALAVLLLLTAASLAALLHLNRAPGTENAWQRFIAPATATVTLGALLYLAGAPLDALRAGLLLPATIVLFGLLRALAMRFRRPVDYAAIGLGGTAVVISPHIPRQRTPGAHRPERVDR